MNDLVSVVVPVYNVEPFLKKCIDTIINQTYTNLEIILVDDGSTDLSGQICDEYKKIDKRIKVIHKDNSGLGLSRNVGIKASKGKYIT
ncbi:glycosyltransferase family A protein, partial [Limosilactobacillus reuteri]